MRAPRGLQQFPNWCRGAEYRVDSIEQLINNRNMKGFTVMKIEERDEVTGEVEELEICLTPPSEQFPSFLDEEKQWFALGKSLVAQRIHPVDVLRFESTIKALKEGRCVGWIGHSGCGKSTESNFLLMLFLKQMGEEGWPKVVAHRVGDVMYEYKLCTDDNRVQCATAPVPDLAVLEQYCNGKGTLPQAEQPVLFLELKEKEQDPLVAPLATFIAVSSRDIHNTLKTLKKSGRLQTFVVRPHTPAEVRMLGRLLYYEDRANLLTNLGLGSDSSEAEAIAVIDKRVETVGPLPRAVLQSAAEYKEYVAEMKSSAPTFLLKLPLRELSYNSIPSECRPFVAPHPVLRTDGTLAGKADYRFLCARAATLIAEKTQTPEQVRTMRECGFDFQVVEAVLQCALRNLPSGEALHEGAQRDQWEWHRDPPHGKALSHDTIITEVSEIPLHRMCDRVARFSGTTFRRCASTLAEGILYVSTVHNFKVGEFFTYDPGDASKGICRSINYYQASSIPLPSHPFAVAALIDVFNSLRLFESVNKDIKLNIICLVDSSQSMTGIKGCRFTATKADLDQHAGMKKTRKGASSSVEVNSVKSSGKQEEETKIMAIKDLTKAFPQFKGRLCTYLVRADIYSMSRFELTSR